SMLCLLHSSACPRIFIQLYLYLFTATSTTDLYTLSLHDALPIYSLKITITIIYKPFCSMSTNKIRYVFYHEHPLPFLIILHIVRSEEHTSELQSRFDLVCRLLLEKKKNHQTYSHIYTIKTQTTS